MRPQFWFDHQRYFRVIIKYLMINILLPGTSPPEPDRRTTVMVPNGIARRNLWVGFKWVTNYNIVVWEEKYRRFFWAPHRQTRISQKTHEYCRGAGSGAGPFAWSSAESESGDFRTATPPLRFARWRAMARFIPQNLWGISLTICNCR